nr:hypothetical protein CFP56_01333 [Quercus suber]
MNDLSSLTIRMIVYVSHHLNTTRFDVETDRTETAITKSTKPRLRPSCAPLSLAAMTSRRSWKSLLYGGLTGAALEVYLGCSVVSTTADGGTTHRKCCVEKNHPFSNPAPLCAQEPTPQEMLQPLRNPPSSYETPWKRLFFLPNLSPPAAYTRPAVTRRRCPEHHRSSRSSGRSEIRKSLAAHAFLADDHPHRIEDALVPVAHAAHGVDLEPAAQDVQRICAGLGDGAGDGAGAEFADRGRVLRAFGREGLAHGFVDHEVEPDVGRDAGDRGDDAAVEREDAAFRLVHGRHGLPHARELAPRRSLEIGERCALDTEARADDIEG